MDTGAVCARCNTDGDLTPGLHRLGPVEATEIASAGQQPLPTSHGPPGPQGYRQGSHTAAPPQDMAHASCHASGDHITKFCPANRTGREGRSWDLSVLLLVGEKARKRG